jgi:hypothetical protein
VIALFATRRERLAVGEAVNAHAELERIMVQKPKLMSVAFGQGWPLRRLFGGGHAAGPLQVAEHREGRRKT